MNEITEPKPQKLRYANALHPQVAAVVNGLYRFRDQAQALARMERLKTQYTIASEQAEDGSLTLWIRDFEVSPQEEEAGYLGHYAVIRCERMSDEDGHYTLQAHKLDKELKNHPLRKRPAARCPNWGHPILRGVLKNKRYATLEEAAGDLEALHLEYPETTIPADGNAKLYLMIFSRRENPKQPLERYVLEIKNQQGGGFMIESQKNTHQRKEAGRPSTRRDAAAGDAAVAEAAPMGHFSSMVALKNKKRKRKSES